MCFVWCLSVVACSCLLFVDWCSLFVVRSLLSAVRCALCGVWLCCVLLLLFVLFAVCCLLFRRWSLVAVCCVLFVRCRRGAVGGWLLVVRCLLLIVCRLLYVCCLLWVCYALFVVRSVLFVFFL